MGTEIIPYLIWYLGAAGIFIVVLRMIATQRWLAAGIALALSLAAYLPFFFVIGWDSLDLLGAELALALVIGVPALVYSKRWSLLVVCLAAGLVPTVAYILPPVVSVDRVFNILAIPIFVWGFTVLSAPVCLALASVFSSVHSSSTALIEVACVWGADRLISCLRD